MFYFPTYQDNYFEEALKMRNLLEEFRCDHGLRPPTILGLREHVFTGRYVCYFSLAWILFYSYQLTFACETMNSVSSLASFMSNQETSFVTLGQRVLANPLK